MLVCRFVAVFLVLAEDCWSVSSEILSVLEAQKEVLFLFTISTLL